MPQVWEQGFFLNQDQVGPLGVNAYTLACPATGEAAVIDAGGGEADLVAAAGRRGWRIVAIINTHGHGDHHGGNAGLKALTGAPIVIGAGDAAYLMPPRNLKAADMFGFKPSPPADRTVVHGDTIEVGRLRLRVIETPGHTPGGICLHLEEAPGHLFTGDTLFVGGVGRTDLPGGDLATLARSITERILALHEETIVWPGHDYGDAPRSTVGREKRTNHFVREFLAG